MASDENAIARFQDLKAAIDTLKSDVALYASEGSADVGLRLSNALADVKKLIKATHHESIESGKAYSKLIKATHHEHDDEEGEPSSTRPWATAYLDPGSEVLVRVHNQFRVAKVLEDRGDRFYCSRTDGEEMPVNEWVLKDSDAWQFLPHDVVPEPSKAKKRKSRGSTSTATTEGVASTTKRKSISKASEPSLVQMKNSVSVGGEKSKSATTGKQQQPKMKDEKEEEEQKEEEMTIATPKKRKRSVPSTPQTPPVQTPKLKSSEKAKKATPKSGSAKEQPEVEVKVETKGTRSPKKKLSLSSSPAVVKTEVQVVEEEEEEKESSTPAKKKKKTPTKMTTVKTEKTVTTTTTTSDSESGKSASVSPVAAKSKRKKKASSSATSKSNTPAKKSGAAASASASGSEGQEEHVRIRAIIAVHKKVDAFCEENKISVPDSRMQQAIAMYEAQVFQKEGHSDNYLKVVQSDQSLDPLYSLFRDGRVEIVLGLLDSLKRYCKEKGQPLDELRLGSILWMYEAKIWNQLNDPLKYHQFVKGHQVLPSLFEYATAILIKGETDPGINITV